MSKQRLVVVGNGMAGARTVEEILELKAARANKCWVAFNDRPLKMSRKLRDFRIFRGRDRVGIEKAPCVVELEVRASGNDRRKMIQGIANLCGDRTVGDSVF